MARYEVEAADLRRRIKAGEFPPGSRLPRVSELAAQRKVSQQTIRSAFSELAKEGVVRVIRGTGAVVQPSAPTRRLIKRGQLVMRSRRVGYVFPAAAGPDEKWVSHGRPARAFVAAPPAVAALFGLESDTNVLRRRRITSPEGEPPFQIADTWIGPQGVADAPQVAEPSTGPGGYLDRLEEAGHGPISWQETTRVRMPTPEEAKLLEIPTALPIFEVTTVGTSARTGEPIEVTVKIIPGDRVEFVAEIRRSESAEWPVRPIESES